MIHKQYYYQIQTLDDLPGEEWKTIEVAPLYSISNFGRVKAETCEKWHSESKQLRFYPSHIMRQGINNKGYLLVSLMNNSGKRKTYRVNRLVLEAFSENPKNLSDACHLNGDSLDNRLANLKWKNHKDNSNCSLRKMRLSKSKGTHVQCDGHEFTSIRKTAKFYSIDVKLMWQWLTGRKPMPKEWKERGLNILRKDDE